MKVTIVSCVYPPEPVVSSRTSAEIAAALAARGDDVTVIAPFPKRPAGIVFDGYQRRPLRIERGNPRVIRCWGLISKTSSVTSRLAENLSFGVTSSLALLLTRKPDIIYSNSWPVFASAMVRSVAAVRRVPVVISVQDLFPESILNLGRISSGSLIARVLRAMDRWVMRGCSRVLVISDRFAEVFRSTRGIVEPQLQIVPNWGDGEVVIDAEASRRFRARLGIGDQERVVVFGGNIGVAAGVDQVVDAARHLTDADSPLRILIAGGGSETERVRAMVQTLGNQRVVLYTPWPASETAELLGAADVFVLPTAGEQSLASVPSKLIAYLLAGRPVIAGAIDGSDLARTIENVRAGWVVAPGDSDGLVNALRVVARADRAELSAMGARGRRHAREHFSRERCLPRVLEALDAAREKR